MVSELAAKYLNSPSFGRIDSIWPNAVHSALVERVLGTYCIIRHSVAYVMRLLDKRFLLILRGAGLCRADRCSKMRPSVIGSDIVETQLRDESAKTLKTCYEDVRRAMTGIRIQYYPAVR